MYRWWDEGEYICYRNEKIQTNGVYFSCDIWEYSTRSMNIYIERELYFPISPSNKHRLHVISPPLGMKGCICHFVKWQIHTFIPKSGYIYSYYNRSITCSLHHNSMPLHCISIYTQGVYQAHIFSVIYCTNATCILTSRDTFVVISPTFLYNTLYFVYFIIIIWLHFLQLSVSVV